MLIYLITDTHFYHSKIIKYEGRPKDFQEKIMKGLRQLPEDCLLIHLGDLCIGRDKEAIELMKELKYRKILVKGNHDGKGLGFYLKGFDAVVDTMTLKVFGKTILFSHKPQPDGDYDINIFGHLHTNIEGIDFSPKQKLLAIENTNYQPKSLLKFIYE